MTNPSPESVIARAIHYDHAPGAGARRIIKALADNGYAVVRNADKRKPGPTHMLGGVAPLTGNFED